MALDNYTNLKKTVLQQTFRKDLTLKFDDFINIAEVEMRSNPKQSLKMNINEKIATASTSTTTRFLALPNDFRSSRKFSITLDDSPRKLTYRTPEQMAIRPLTGTPCFFTVRANQIEFDILPSIVFVVTITYDVEETPLTVANPTNDILDKYPHIYLYGCLKQAFIYTQDLDQATIYDGLFTEAIDAANNSEHDIKYPTQPQESVMWAP